MSIPNQEKMEQAIRVSVNFAPDTYKALEELAKGKTIPEALRDAIALSKWFKDTRLKGDRIVVIKPNGESREIVYPQPE